VDKQPLVEVENLVKRFGKQVALDHVCVRFPKGQIHGIIGRNGSGKTVLLKTICGFLRPDEGTVSIGGREVKYQAPLRNTGIIIESPGFIPGLSGLKNLQMLASLRDAIGTDRIVEVMQIVGLDPAERKPVAKYSMGMRQRLGLAQAIMEDPELLILDEPLNGLDNRGVEGVRSLLLELKDRGTTILLASHSREDIRILCDTVHEMDLGVLQ